jgi:hypothetical protein
MRAAIAMLLAIGCYYVYLMYKHLYGDQSIAVPGGRSADWSIYAARAP